MKLRRLNLKKRRFLSACFLKKKPIKFMRVIDEIYFICEVESFSEEIHRFGKRGTPVTAFQKLPI